MRLPMVRDLGACKPCSLQNALSRLYFLSSKIGMNLPFSETFQFLDNLKRPKTLAFGQGDSRLLVQGLYFLASFFPLLFQGVECRPISETFQFLDNLKRPKTLAFGQGDSRLLVQGLYFLASFFPLLFQGVECRPFHG